MPDEPKQGNPATYQLVCAAVAVAPLIYMVVLTVLKFSGTLPDGGMGDISSEAATPLSLALLFGGFVASSSSLVLKKIILRGQGTDSPEGRFKAVLVSMAIAESGAVMGLVLTLLTGDLLYGGLLCGLSFAVTCFHFPSRYWLEQGDAPL